MRNIFFVSPDDVKASSQVNYNVDEGVLAAAIRESQKVYLKDLIGKRLLESLQDKIEDNTIDDEENAQYKELLDDYIFDYLVAQSQVCTIAEISLKIRNIGLSQDYDANIQTATVNGIEYARDYYETQAVNYWNRIVCFLRENKKAFPELEECGCRDCDKPHLIIRVNTGLQI